MLKFVSNMSITYNSFNSSKNPFLTKTASNPRLYRDTVNASKIGSFLKDLKYP